MNKTHTHTHGNNAIGWSGDANNFDEDGRRHDNCGTLVQMNYIQIENNVRENCALYENEITTAKIPPRLRDEIVDRSVGC